MLQAAGLLLGAYFLGGVPSAYVLARWARGVDIREHGTGNVGTNNALTVIGPWAFVVVALIDAGKAALPTWLALHVFDLGYPLSVAAGLLAAVGHAWSPYLGFTGGRGLACILGVLAVLFPEGALIQIGVMLVGVLLHNELFTTFGLISMPIIADMFGRPDAVILSCTLMLALTLTKRIEANGTPLPEGAERWPVVWRRIWLDRDVTSRKEWIARDHRHLH